MQYEIEIKSLLGSQAASDALMKQITKRDPKLKLISEQKQLNHYFHGGNLTELIGVIKQHLSTEQIAAINEIATTAKHVNVRTRQKNGTVLLIVKGSLDDTSAAHSHQRMEFEAEIDLTIDELDDLVLSSGWQLEAKWQAKREIYEALGLTIDLMFSPGYGYVVEFEKVVSDESDRTAAHDQVIAVMESLGVRELPNDRLERMFAYYNEHWPEYYGTDRVFTIE